MAFPPPPTWADITVEDEATKKHTFNPIWLNWFLGLSQPGSVITTKTTVISGSINTSANGTYTPATTGAGFKPTGVVLLAWNANGGMSIGAYATGTGCAFTTAYSNPGFSSGSTTKILYLERNAITGPDTGTLQSLDNDGFTLNIVVPGGGGNAFTTSWIGLCLA